MTDNVEREIKLAAGDDLIVPDLDGVAPGVTIQDSGTELLEATYWDTDDLSLVRQRYGFRHRRRRDRPDRPGIWTLKTPGRREGDAVVRGEYEVEAGATEPPSELLALLPADVDPAGLHPVAVLHTERRVLDIADSGGVRRAEVVDDRVEVHDQKGAVVERFRELEVEVSGDDTAIADAVVRRLRAAGAGPPESSSKYARALRALGHDIEPTPGS
jgi:inorganic triphosphatase YgiF